MTLDGNTENDNNNGAAPETENVPAPLNEVVADNNLVDRAYEKVQDVFIEAISNSMDSLGDYFFETFFNKNIDRARKKQPTKQMSFLKLIERLQETDADTPSKSWLYNAVNIAADKAHFEEIEFPEYNKLSVTQRVYIARVSDIEKKKELIEEILEKGYSVRELKDRIDEIKPKRVALGQGDEYDKEFMDKLRLKSTKSLENIIKNYENTIRKLNKKIEENQDRGKIIESSKHAAEAVLKEKEKEQRKLDRKK